MNQSFIHGIPPLVVAVATQLVSGAVIFGASRVFGFDVPLVYQLVAQGLLAGGMVLALGLPWWWMSIQIVLPPAVLGALDLQIPGWAYLALFIVTLLVFWNSAGTRVPLYLSNKTTMAELDRLLPQGTAFVDLGCGIGGVLSYLAEARPDGRFLGVETAPMPYLISRLRSKPNLRFKWGSMWNVDLAEFDVVYCFLSPAPMPEIFEKAQKEMRPGSILISNSFEVPDHPAHEIIEVDDRRRTRLHLWKM